MGPTKDKGVQIAPYYLPNIEAIPLISAAITSSKKMQVPPPATRHRGVLVVVSPTSVPLYDFSNRMGEATLLSLMNESRNALPLFDVETICTDMQQLCESETQMVEITVRFYGSRPSEGPATNSLKRFMAKEIQAVMPKSWTPRMYLGAVNLSIERNQSILIEAIYFRGQRYISINDVHWLFTDQNVNDPSHLASQLVLNAAYFNVTGGERSNL